jgi:glucose/arabinose dehydrogenase
MSLHARFLSSAFPRGLAGGLGLLLLGAGAPAFAATLPTGFSETRLMGDLASPTAMSFAPDGRLFVCEQGGRLRVIRDGVVLPDPFATISVNSAGERGLLGVAVDPDFATNRFVYVYYTTSSAPIHNRLARFTASATNPDVADPSNPPGGTPLLDLPNLSSATNHNGGAIHFGADGRLYIAVGDNANGANAQSLTTRLGKILRINKDGSIPADNPLNWPAPNAGTTSGVNRAIWARGLRNPFTFAIQPGTGRLLINDVGQNTWEEVNDGIAGSNYGWPMVEGPEPPNQAGLRYPLHSYANAGSNCAIVGAAFYNPPVANFPSEFQGRYFFGDFCGGFIRTLSPPAYNTSAAFATGISSLVDLQVGPDGALYYLSRGTDEAVFRVVFDDNAPPEITDHPDDLTVAVGQAATFRVAASGGQLRFQWQRNGANIPGATSVTFTLASAQASDDGARFRAVVTNDFGSATSNEAVLTVTSNASPVASINAPTAGSLFGGGQTIAFAGGGTDPEDGTLPASALTWRVDLHHEAHTHPFLQPTTGISSGSFVTSDRGHPEPTTFYRVTLTVRDSGGLSHTVFVDVRPRTSRITITTSPAGLALTLDGQPRTAPYAEDSVEGVFRTLGVVSPQTSGGVTYTFTSWSDGGAATHEVPTPVADTTYTATFQAAAVTTVFSDQFASNLGWVRNRLGTDTATTGLWERGDPAPTSSGGATMQLGNGAGGTVNCLTTGRLAGSSVGANDVDGGVTSIDSPLITLPPTGTLTLSFFYYFAHLNNATSADFFRVSVVNGTAATAVFQEAGTAAPDAAAYVQQSLNLTPFAGQTIRLRFEAADAAGGSLVEAGVDSVLITRQ